MTLNDTRGGIKYLTSPIINPKIFGMFLYFV